MGSFLEAILQTACRSESVQIEGQTDKLFATMAEIDNASDAYAKSIKGHILAAVPVKVNFREGPWPLMGHATGIPYALWGWIKTLETKQRKNIGPFVGATNRKGIPLPHIDNHPLLPEIAAAHNPKEEYPAQEEMLEWTNERYDDWLTLVRVIKVRLEAALAQDRKFQGHLVDMFEGEGAEIARRVWTGELYCVCGCDKRRQHCLGPDKGLNYKVKKLSECYMAFPELAPRALHSGAKHEEPTCLLCDHKREMAEREDAAAARALEEGRMLAHTSWAAAASSRPSAAMPAELGPVEYRWEVFWKQSSCDPEVPITYDWLRINLCRSCSCTADVSLKNDYYFGYPDILQLKLLGVTGQEFDRRFENQRWLEVKAPDKGGAEAEFIREFHASISRRYAEGTFPHFE